MTTLPAPVKPELVYCDLEAGTKEAALHDMVQALAAAEPSIVIEEILHALDERERQGPFSIAKGVAFPHARTEGVQDFTIVIGTCPRGLDFRARDGQPVRIIVLFVIPKKHSNLYLRTLAWFLNHFHEAERVERVAALSTPEEVISALGGKETSAGPNVFKVCPFTVTARTPLRSVLALMAENRLEAIPVVDEQQALAGEVTIGKLFQEGDIETLLESAGDAPVEPFVTTDGYFAVEEDRSAGELAKELSGRGVGRAYRIDDGRLRGIATLADLLHLCWKKG